MDQSKPYLCKIYTIYGGVLACLLFACLLPGCQVEMGDPALLAEPPDARLAVLVEAERTFARTAETRGLRTAFLDNLADSSVLLNPALTPARPYYEGQPDRPGLLLWEPLFAIVASSNDLGFTTGPWTYRPDPLDSTSYRYGHYVSVWSRTSETPWKVVIDGGIPHAQMQGPAELVLPSGRQRAFGGKQPASALEAERTSLLALEEQLTVSAQAEGVSTALQAHARPDVRLYRAGFLPAVGHSDADNLLAKTENPSTWEPVGVHLSADATLACTYGHAYTGTISGTSSPPPTHSYLRIWRKEGKAPWQIALDLTLPLE